MSLIKCPECKKKISSESRACVHCGFPVPENYIDTTPETSTLVIDKPKWLTKRLIIIISVIIGIILLSVGGILVYRQTTIDKFMNMIARELVLYERENHNNKEITYDDVYNTCSIIRIYKYTVREDNTDSSIYDMIKGEIYYSCVVLSVEKPDIPKSSSGYYIVKFTYNSLTGDYIFKGSRGPYSYNELPTFESSTRII